MANFAAVAVACGVTHSTLHKHGNDSLVGFSAFSGTPTDGTLASKTADETTITDEDQEMASLFALIATIVIFLIAGVCIYLW